MSENIPMVTNQGSIGELHAILSGPKMEDTKIMWEYVLLDLWSNSE